MIGTDGFEKENQEGQARALLKQWLADSIHNTQLRGQEIELQVRIRGQTTQEPGELTEHQSCCDVGTVDRGLRRAGASVRLLCRKQRLGVVIPRLTVTGRQKQNRHRIARIAQFLKDGPAALVRQHNIKNDQVVAGKMRLIQAILGRICHVNNVTVLGKPLFEKTCGMVSLLMPISFARIYQSMNSPVEYCAENPPTLLKTAFLAIKVALERPSMA